MTAKCHPAAMRFIPDQLESDRSIKDTSSSPDSLEKEPIRLVLLVQACKYLFLCILIINYCFHCQMFDTKG